MNESLSASIINFKYPKPNAIIIFAGNFGSGKTEIAINYALQLRHTTNTDVTVVDLDIVKPYFRCRSATEFLQSKGIQVIIPPGEYRYADLPIVMPQIKGVILQQTGYLILDVGGEDTGARVLSYLSDAFQQVKTYELLIVINRSRPFTGDWSGVKKILSAIEQSAGLKFTGLVSNNHLMQDTNLETILSGYELTQEVSRYTQLPIFMVAVSEQYAQKAQSLIPEQILPIHRHLLPPHLSKGKWAGM